MQHEAQGERDTNNGRLFEMDLRTSYSLQAN
jgi:hypothetical protein